MAYDFTHRKQKFVRFLSPRALNISDIKKKRQTEKRKLNNKTNLLPQLILVHAC